ncbi:UDP-N-acetylglucosamine--N-acetylmuramyl-(pentapeptide) pyrophosphoryl-undecaprenol N-acetylglucosamine transferase [Demequina sediminicola]|uniref:UDP-N-acetylglucosamine--N-acetylmuramyl- (pentapeptide) pyrophosphoryl-undecaprenol N-acetylglucosamine transferase n=1 Tax=Demequina sediminicola TaxID=1095026 RepID=UPI000B1CF146|nr:UDP-N-acetylglucosamine--N-acetylmuramyl-(pentapeptide) pyrophosphoryl-undecaprenol N-acetylglucosamine transferase [Demequina sediminicola]
MSSVLLAGGGSAGHVNPMLATAHELRRRGHDVAALGTTEGLEADLVPRAGIEMHVVPRVPMPRRPSGDLLRLPKNLKSAVAAARIAIDDTGAQAVVGFGGFVSTPAYLAARKAGIPIVIHEANARPGLANKLGVRWAARVGATLPGTPLKGAVVTGMPLMPPVQALAEQLAAVNQAPTVRAQARDALGWPADAPVLVVTGGSQGAASLNAATVGAVDDLTAAGVYVWHITGKGKSEVPEAAKATLPPERAAMYRVDEYCHDMAEVYSAATAIVCRSGAGTVAEVTAMQLPAVFVPFPHGNGEQALNAVPAVDAGAGEIVTDADLTPAVLVARAQALVLGTDAESEGARMRRAAAEFATVDGAARVADLVEEVL